MAPSSPPYTGTTSPTISIQVCMISACGSPNCWYTFCRFYMAWDVDPPLGAFSWHVPLPYMAIYGPYIIIYGPNMAIYGPYMAIYGNIWTIYFHIRPYMAHIWPYIYIYICIHWLYISPYTDHMWPYMIIYGHMWSYMAHIWPIYGLYMAIYDHVEYGRACQDDSQ